MLKAVEVETTYMHLQLQGPVVVASTMVGAAHKAKGQLPECMQQWVLGDVDYMDASACSLAGSELPLWGPAVNERVAM
jgi:hypothetical protein